MSDKRPKVGVALLAYNQGKYVDEAIESLKKQTFQDFEVWLIDDGSNDGFTPKKLESIQYDKISQKYLHKDNIGGPKRRKQYDLLMKNKYIINFCGDDILAPDFLKKCVNFLDRNNEYGAVCTNIRLFKNNIKDYFYEKQYDKNVMKFPEMLVSCNMLGSSLIRREALKKIDLDWPLKRFYDWNRWNAMLDAGWKLGLVSEPLFFYRQLDNSLSHTSNKEDEFAFRLETEKRYKKYFKKYYREIIEELFKYQAELQEAKDWLDGQYHSLNKEIDRLNKENDELKQEIKRLSEACKDSFPRKIVRKARSKIRKKSR